MLVTPSHCRRRLSGGCPAGRYGISSRAPPYTGVQGIHHQGQALAGEASSTVSMRNRRPSASVSLTKSNDQRWFSRGGMIIGLSTRQPRSMP